MAPEKPQGRLFRKYVLLFVSLVSGVLLASGLIEIYFSFQENKTALVRIQREKALAAAFKIEQFIKEIERQVAFTTQSSFGPPSAVLKQRELDYLRLFKNSLALMEISYLDASGKEQLWVSRLAMDKVGSQEDFSQDPKFLNAKSGATYFSVVYFRQESEPYMTIAIGGSGRRAGVTVAELNLKFIWDVVDKIKIGEAGHAYVLDSRGHLIAHPDISLVLQKTDLSTLPYIQAVRADPSQAGQAQDKASIAQNFQGTRVLTASAAIAPMGWLVFVDLPLEEAFAPIYSSIIRTVVLLLIGFALSLVASLVLARRMVTPIRALRAGAAQIGAGDLSHRLKVETGDELEALGDQFNSMTEQLQQSYANLEQKVDDRTRQLSESLEQQTATSKVLQVISRSTFDLQPVLETLVENAARLCAADSGFIWKFDGKVFRITAQYGASPELTEFFRQNPIPPGRGSVTGRAALERRTIQIADVLTDSEYQLTEAQKVSGYRTLLGVPMLREGVLVGVFGLQRYRVEPFGDKQLELVTTFADQAVIAIENVRLFQELQARTRDLGRSVEELKALGEVSQAVSSTLDLETVLTTIVSHANQLSGTDGGVIYEYDEGTQEFRLRVTQRFEEELVKALQTTPIRLGEGAVGQAAALRQPVQIPDVLEEGAYWGRLREVILKSGFRAFLAVPLLREDRIIGGLVVARRSPGEFPPQVIDLLKTFATQSALATQNASLFREIEDKGQQLEVANRHKSEFLANMSHELRTPLNAIIGFSEVLKDHMFGGLNEKQTEYLEDIYASGRHLLSLINDILDLSKIEAGRMELELGTFNLPLALDNALTLVRERAGRHGITLDRAVDARLGEFVGDERKVKQILLNLLSNAVKFTPEGGRVSLKALPADGAVEISVSDTGIGIAPEDHEVIFEGFRQVGRDYAEKREGTGLGLTLTRKFVEMHGGKIWVKSELGQGATFTFTLPVRRWPGESQS